MKKEQFAELMEGIKGYLARNVQPVFDRVKALEQWRASVPADLKGDPGDRGEPGKDADPEVIAALVAEGIAKALPAAIQKAFDEREADMVAKAAAAVPVPRDGVDGLPGKDGEPGVDGKSVEMADVEALVVGVVDKAIGAREQALIDKAVAAIPRPNDGRDGKDGADVDMEVVKAVLSEMVAALPKAVDGKDGRDGTNGRDALELDVRRGLDPLRRYHPNEVIAYRGGMIRSYRQTDPMPDGGDLEAKGWHVITNGIAELAADLSEDGRRLGLAISMTDGSLVTKTVALPTTIYRGIWRDGYTYTKGDQATRDGSSWTLMVDDPRGKPGDDGSGWVLSSKRGRDGTDGLKGERGERGKDAVVRQ